MQVTTIYLILILTFPTNLGVVEVRFGSYTFQQGTSLIYRMNDEIRFFNGTNIQVEGMFDLNYNKKEIWYNITFLEDAKGGYDYQTFIKKFRTEVYGESEMEGIGLFAQETFTPTFYHLSNGTWIVGLDKYMTLEEETRVCPAPKLMLYYLFNPKESKCFVENGIYKIDQSYLQEGVSYSIHLSIDATSGILLDERTGWRYSENQANTKRPQQRSFHRWLEAGNHQQTSSTRIIYQGNISIVIFLAAIILRKFKRKIKL